MRGQIQLQWDRATDLLTGNSWCEWAVLLTHSTRSEFALAKQSTWNGFKCSLFPGSENPGLKIRDHCFFVNLTLFVLYLHVDSRSDCWKVWMDEVVAANAQSLQLDIGGARGNQRVLWLEGDASSSNSLSLQVVVHSYKGRTCNLSEPLIVIRACHVSQCSVFAKNRLFWWIGYLLKHLNPTNFPLPSLTSVFSKLKPFEADPSLWILNSKNFSTQAFSPPTIHFHGCPKLMSICLGPSVVKSCNEGDW